MPGERPNILLDSGANAEVQAEWLVQFAQMGSVYAGHRLAIERPKVGLLSIGEEPGKGDNLRKEAHELLSTTPGIHFVGNVEGRDLLTDAADVIVTDGFTGNVVLKTLEGAVKAVFARLFSAFGETAEIKLHADALAPVVWPIVAELDPDTYGGAVLLGVDGVCIISHGSSGPTAMVNAITLARDLVDSQLVAAIRAAVSAPRSGAGSRRPAGHGPATRLDRCGPCRPTPTPRSTVTPSSRSSATTSPTSWRSTRRPSARGSRSSTTSMPTRWR